ncbi:MAG: hypothetical protein JWQ28_1082 [Pedobacter sp.]|jgi:hypothetical protein|nr:hypothetical protein [Pedobacter sp.]
MKSLFLSFSLLLLCSLSFAQDTVSHKKLQAKRTTVVPKIDGILNDAAWEGVPIATGFIENNPTPGRVETAERGTEVKMIYDDNAVYVAVRMHAKQDSVAHEIMTRDQIGNSDFFGIFFDTFLDGINGNGFFVTASGTQFDAKYSQVGGEDPNWNAVWESNVNIDEKGWTVEMRIPYSALRFSSKDVQKWGLNFIRKRAYENSQTFWNFVDPKVNGLMNQSGIWEGLRDIKAPLRLSFSPYISAYANHYPYNIPGVKNTTTSFNGGMDVKYGINSSFTLDMTLIPDFGQVQSDNRILNLTPFEVKFDENRSFFTEGTELFNKGDLFYSRRIGASPSFFNDISGQLQPGERITKSPQESKVINATKISGRTAKGLGIGVFNAVTNTMYSEVEDSLGNKREIQSQPLTNYNVLVLDQTLKNNSSVSFINTNVLRQGSSYDANVSAFLLNLNDKKNVYYVNAATKMSYLTANPERNKRSGYYYEVEAGKQSGTFTWSYNQKLADRRFDPSDMGFFTNNNFLNQTAILHYNIYKPGKWYNTIQSYFAFNYSRMFKPSAFQSYYMEQGTFVRYKNLWSTELDFNWKAKGNDFYESRNGKVFQTPESFSVRLFVNPNRSKAYNFGGNIGFEKQKLFNGRTYYNYFFQNLRVNDKLRFSLDLDYQPSYDYVGWVAFNGNETVFSRYDRNTVENVLNVKYSFTNRMGINVRLRHYWSDRRNSEFYTLNPNGSLAAYKGPALTGTDRNYNVFNIDFIYTWQFAPGSELSVAYKDVSENSENAYTKRYFNNLNRTVSGPQNNSLSIKMLYYIDYLDLRGKRKHK